MNAPHRFSILLLIGLLAIACSTKSPNYLRSELANKGPMLLNKENPFLAPNMFLALERDTSPLVERFLKHRGEPDAVEVRKDIFKALRVYFFYLDANEGYVFEQRGESWIVMGPEQIPTSISQGFAGTSSAPPALAVKSSEAPHDSRLEIDKYLNETSTIDETTLEPAKTIDVNTSSPLAKGDIVHTVRFPGETLRIVSSWYTGNPSNAARIARINAIANPDILHLDQEIRIPAYLITKRAALPEQEIERYLQTLSE